MAVNIYDSTDANAPSLLGKTAGSLIALLDACLVNGYTGKSAAGWTKPFSAAGKGVYLSPQTNAKYLRVSNLETTAETGYDYEARINGFQTMSDVDTGTEQFPSTAQESGTTNMAVIPLGSTAVESSWSLIESSGFFWLIIRPNTSTYTQLYGFGMFESKLPGDTDNTLLLGGKHQSTGYCYTYHLQTGQIGVTSFLAKGYNGAVGDHISLWPMYGYNPQGLSFSAPAQAFDSKDNLGAHPFSPIVIGDKGGTTYASIRGWLPGFWTSPAIGTSTLQSTFSPSQGIASGRTLSSFKADNSSTPVQFYIETSDTWGGL